MSFIDTLYSIILTNPWILDLLKILIVIIAAIVVDRYIARRTKIIAKKLDIPVGIVSGLITFFRFLLLAAVLLVIATSRFIPPDYFIGASALIGTAVGFGLSRFLSDYISGLYVLLSGAFRIGDYIRIDGEEGIVIEMTTSHTKIRRNDGSILAIANSAIAGKSVVNYRVDKNGETYYVYTVRVSFDLGKYGENIEKIIRDFVEKYKKNGIDVSFSMVSLTRLEAVFDITIKVRNPEVIPKLRSEILLRLLSSST